MAIQFDEQTLERLRRLPPRQAFEQARDAVFRTGEAGSDDFGDMYDQLVREGIVTRIDIEQFEGR